jgi:hypothetical protein
LAFVSRNDQAQRALVCAKVFAIDGVGDDHSFAGKVGVEFRERKDRAIPVGGFGHHAKRHVLPAKIAGLRHTCPCENRPKGHAFVFVGKAVVTLRGDFRARHGLQLGACEMRFLFDRAGDDQRRCGGRCGCLCSTARGQYSELR